MGGRAARDRGQEHPGAHLPAAQGAGRRTARDPRARATSCGSIPPSWTWRASSSSWTRRGDGEPAAAAQTLREALALWRGPPFADLAYQPFAQAEIARLEELRLAALEQRIDADLADGRHAALVGELERLVAEHPLRERLRGQLMLALYRSGRQAEALDAYRTARRELSEELGLEPGEELKRLEQAILRHDPALELSQQRSPPRAVATQPAAPDRSLLIVPRALDGLDRAAGAGGAAGGRATHRAS